MGYLAPSEIFESLLQFFLLQCLDGWKNVTFHDNLLKCKAWKIATTYLCLVWWTILIFLLVQAAIEPWKSCASCHGGIYLTISLAFFHGFGLLEFCQILCSTCWVMCCIISFLLCWILFHWSHTLYAMVNVSSGPYSACYQPPPKTHSQSSPVARASVVSLQKNYWPF